MKKRALSVVSLLMAILMLTGCGSKSGETGGGTTTPEGEPSKTVSIAISENCITLDPHNANNQGSLIVSDCVYEPLIQTDNEGGYYPWLAESWEYDETGTVWTFHLRDGVKFNNGEPLTSADVVCSYQRLIDEYDSLCRAVELFPDHLLQSVEAPDESTVVITLARPYSVALFSFAKTMIIPKSVYEEQGADMFYQQNLVATGPWKLEKWVDGQYAHYTKNADYWNPNYDSYYEELYVRHVLENSTAVAGHLSGDLDANLTTGGINPDMLALYSGSESRIEIVPVEVFSYYYMGFQCGEGSPFADINVRKAFECAIDRQTILDSIMGAESFSNIILPALTLGYPMAAEITRVGRSGMIDTLSEDYITATYAKGISRRVVNWKYAFKNALIPIITLVGMSIGSYLAGAVVVETVFAWPGIGQLTNQAVGNRDYQLVQSLLLVSATLFTLINLVVDIINSLVDPRVSLE